MLTELPEDGKPGISDQVGEWDCKRKTKAGFDKIKTVLYIILALLALIPFLGLIVGLIPLFGQNTAGVLIAVLFIVGSFITWISKK